MRLDETRVQATRATAAIQSHPQIVPKFTTLVGRRVGGGPRFRGDSAMSKLDEFLSAEDVSSLRADTAIAKGLPGRAYGAGFYELERRELFPKLWCVVGFVSDLPNPGDVVPAELAGFPLILVRSDDGEIRGFHNICRHRGMRLVGECASNCKSFVCPWHGWRYALDGTLLATPRVGGEDRHEQAGLEHCALGLVGVRLACWQDFVFANLDSEAPPFDEHIAPLRDLLDSYDLGSLRRAASWSIEYPSNWKVAIEGAIEDYHLPIGHPQLVRGVCRWNAQLDCAPQCYYSNSTAREYADAGESNIVVGLRSGLPAIPSTGDNLGPRRSYFMNVFPTGMFQMHVDNAVLGMFLPVGSAKTKLVFNHYFVGDAATDPAFESQRAQIIEGWQLVFEQDIPFVRAVHENYAASSLSRISTRYSEFWEKNVHRFQRHLVDVIARER